MRPRRSLDSFVQLLVPLGGKQVYLSISQYHLGKFESLQLIPVYAFTSKLMDAETSFIKALKKPSAKFPIIYPVEPAEFQVLQAPMEFRLRKRKPHNFDFLVKGVVDVFLYEDDENVETFVKDDTENRYTLEYTTKEEVKIEIVIETTAGELFTILEYEIY